MKTFRFTYPYNANFPNPAYRNSIIQRGDDAVYYYHGAPGDVGTLEYVLVDYHKAPWSIPGYVAPQDVENANVQPTTQEIYTPAQNVAVQTERREGNDLLIYYPNGTVERYKDHFSPVNALTTIAASPSPWVPKAISSDTRIGDDRLIRFFDGSQKVLTNYYCPPVPDYTKLNAGAYTFGTDYDPERLAHLGQVVSTPFLSSDEREVNARVLRYSDGTSKRLENWYLQNPGYAPADSGINVVVPDFSMPSTAPLPQASQNYIPDPRNQVPPVPAIVQPGATGQPVPLGGGATGNTMTPTVNVPLTSVLPLDNKVAPNIGSGLGVDTNINPGNMATVLPGGQISGGNIVDTLMKNPIAAIIVGALIVKALG